MVSFDAKEGAPMHVSSQGPPVARRWAQKLYLVVASLILVGVVSEGLLIGPSQVCFSPQNTASRSRLVSIIVRSVQDMVLTRPVLPPRIVSRSARETQSRAGAGAPGSRGHARPSRQSQSQKAFCIAMRDPLFVGGAHRELVQEGARLHHRGIGIVG